jgi:hypothetical protein
MTRADIAQLLRGAQMRNMNLDITGLLLQVDNRFIQYLEGPREAVTGLLRRIQQDPRHHHFEQLFEGPVAVRLFQDWSMAFSDFGASEFVGNGRGALLQQVLEQPLPADRPVPADHVLHRFWVHCAQSMPA